MAIIQTIKLKDRIKNDTSNSVKFTYLNGVGDPVDITTWDFRIQFRYRSKKGLIVLDVTNGSGITLTDPTNGIFELDEFILDWEVDTYYFDVQATFAGEVKTYIQGTWCVKQDTTY